MTEPLSLATAARLVRGLGSQIAMSVAVSVGVAGVFAVPGLLFPKKEALVVLAPVERSQASAWLASAPVEGKIGDRLHAASVDGLASPRTGLMAPAALVMPMSTGWPQPAFAEPVRVAVVQSEKPARVTLADAAPVRRPAVASERPKPAIVPATAPASAPIAIAAASDPVVEDVEPTLLGRVVYAPVIRATTLVSSAAGMVGSAGSWTVSQATGLLPRW